MGGFGGGSRWGSISTETTDNYLALDVRSIHRKGLLGAGRALILQWEMGGNVLAKIGIRIETNRLVLSYRHRPRGKTKWVDHSDRVAINWTSCNFGGNRPWFRCPVSACERRCAILYGGARFACRKCAGLAYASQRECSGDRAARKLDKIRNRLGWEPGFFNGPGSKPKGMHQRTFYRLLVQHEECARQVIASLRI